MNPIQWLIEYSPVAWLNALTAHQLDTIRTASIAVGSALIPVGTFLLGWGIKLLRRVRRDAEQAREQTAHVEHVGGEQRSVSVVDYARDAAEQGRHAVVSGEATRQEVSDLGGWIRGTGRRRLPTTEILSQPTAATDTGASHYE